MKAIASVIGTAIWIWGIVLAKGFWLTVAALCVPFVSWYLVIAHYVS
jgi:hypothetical protein